MFPRSAAVLALLVAIPAGTVTAEPAVKPVPVRVAEHDVTTLDIPGDIHTVVVANPEIADTSVTSQHKLMLLGKKPGYTTLLVIGADGGRLLTTTVMVTPEEKGVLTVDRGVKETNMTCSPRCVTTEAAKDTSGGASPGPAAASPSLPAAPPSPSPGGSPGGASGGAPPLTPPTVQINQ